MTELKWRRPAASPPLTLLTMVADDSIQFGVLSSVLCGQ